LAVVRGGLPVPLLQHPVGPYFLDLAYPAIRLAIEYDGRDHLDPARALRDLDRQAYLTGAGWRVLRFRAAEVYRPVVVANRVRRELVDHARRRGLTVPAVLALIDAKAAGASLRRPPRCARIDQSGGRANRIEQRGRARMTCSATPDAR
jgi:hypothetical protein